MSLTKWAVILVALGLAMGLPGLGLMVATNYAPSSYGQVGTLLVLITALSALALGFLTMTAGVALHVFGPVFADRAKQYYAGYATILGSFYLAVLVANLVVGIYLFVSSGFSLTPAENGIPRIVRDATGPSTLIASTLAQELALLAILYFRIIRPKVVEWKDLGLAGGRWIERLGQGLLCAVTVILVNGIVETSLGHLGIRQTQSQLFAVLRQGTPLQFAIMLIAAGGVAAFVEEAFFRGYIFGSLYRQHGARHAYLASALIFAAVHLPYWQAMPAIFVVGLIFSFVARRSESIVPTIIAHGMNNTVGLAVIYFGMA